MRYFLIFCVFCFPRIMKAQIDSAQIICRPQTITKIGVRDLLAMYRQRDTLQTHRASGQIQFRINAQEVFPTDTISNLYVASLLADYPALDSLYASYLQTEVFAFTSQKDSLLQHIRHVAVCTPTPHLYQLPGTLTQKTCDFEVV